MKSLAVAAVVALSCGAIAGCGKNSPLSGTATTGSDAVTLMASTLQLPVPGGSYGPSGAAGAAAGPIAGTNVTKLVSIVDSVALPVKESRSRFAQFVNEGVRQPTSLNTVDPALNASLIGIRNDAKGIITWTYTLAGTAYFNGTTGTLGTTGDLTFTPSGVKAHWGFTSGGASITKTVLIADGADSLTFTLTYAGGNPIPQVTLSGSVGGSPVSGAWDSAHGGSYQTGAAASGGSSAPGTKFCWTAQLQDAACQ